METVWVFTGDHARHPAGVFASKDEGLAWASARQVSGLLSAYPVGDGCYDIAVREEYFRPSAPHHGSPEHVAGFTPGWTEHIHLVAGKPA